MPRFHPKSCVLTGGTSGIGRAVARALVTAGAHVVLVARQPEKCRAQLAELRRSGPGTAAGILADLSVQADVRRAAEAIQQQVPRLDVLINCAAIVPARYTVTADGIEMQWAVNHLAPFLLTTLLIDHLGASAPARVVTVTSQLEANGQVVFADLNRGDRYEPQGAYCRTKLANVLFTLELARRLSDTGVTATCVHPGVCATTLLNDYIGRPKLFRFLTALRASPAAAGAAHVTRLALAPEVEGTTGVYFREASAAVPSARARDLELARQLWDFSEAQVGLHPA